MTAQTRQGYIAIGDLPVARFLFNNVRIAWLWLIVRIYVGYSWLHAGLEKFENPAWMNTGEALRGFWTRAVAIPDAPARPAIAFNWYRVFLQSLLDSQSYVWFAKLITIGEILIGVALILGILTGIAAFFGGFMNWNFMMAGSASTNPVLFTLAVLLLLAWKTSGWYGLDRFALPKLINSKPAAEKLPSPSPLIPQEGTAGDD